MYSRNESIRLKPDSAPEFARLLEKEIFPLLRKQTGFKDEISFVSPERNEAMTVSFWDNLDDAEFYNHVAYLDVLRVLSKVLDGMPTTATFEVANSTSHQIAASAVN
jgi:hypothetical protein